MLDTTRNWFARLTSACIAAAAVVGCSGDSGFSETRADSANEEFAQQQQGLGVCSEVTLKLSPKSPAEWGTPVTLTATATGCSEPRYLFQVRNKDEFGVWSDWATIMNGTADHVTVFDLVATDYQFRVRTKDKTASGWESTAKKKYTIAGVCHAPCETGAPMEPTCEGAAAVCESDPYCCTYGWDEECTAQVEPECVVPEMVVFNDQNPFDNTGMANESNQTMVENLVGFTGPGSRAAGTVVHMDYGHFPACAPHCGPASGSFMTMYSTITGLGMSVVDTITPLNPFAPNVKVVVLWTPTLEYTLDELNALKAFAAEGGRIVFIGEYDLAYGATGLAVENTFLSLMGSEMTNIGGAFDCGFMLIPASQLAPHSVTANMDDVLVACSSALSLSPSDLPIYRDTTGSVVLSASTFINTVPLTELPPVIPSELSSVESAVVASDGSGR